MKALKKIFYIIVLLAAVFFVVALFLPKEFVLEREVTINKPAEVVFAQVVNFENRVKWSPWAALDPGAENTYEGTMGEIGSSWMWEGDPEKVGTGSLEIVNLKLGQLIETKLVFVSPRAGEANGRFTFNQTDTGTKVMWHFDQKLAYPVERYVGMFLLDGMLGPKFESGLQKLKTQCEALPEEQMEESTAKEEGGA